MKKFFVTLLSLITFVSLGLGTSATAKTENVSLNDDLAVLESKIPYEVREKMSNQTDALRSYQNIIDSFAKDENGLSIYPIEYAGAFIDNEKLVIQLTDCSETFQDKYLQFCENDEKISFKEVQYSLNDLLSYESYALDMAKNGYNVIGYGICEKENSFEIYLDSSIEKDASAKYDLIGERLELPINISYQEPVISCATMWGGDAIYNEDTGSSMTVGICGTYNGQNALLTCGHGNEEVGIIFPRYPYITYGGTRIGQVSYQRANTSSLETGVDSLGDFAIVSLNSDVTTTNKIYGALNVVGTYSSLPEGTTIYKYGKTSGLSYGTITQSSISYAIEYSDGLWTVYYVRGLYKSSMQNSDGTHAIEAGDSGGPVYIKDGANYLLHGIVTARQDPGEQVASIMYSTPIYYAIDAGFTVKTN